MKMLKKKLTESLSQRHHIGCRTKTIYSLSYIVFLKGVFTPQGTEKELKAQTLYFTNEHFSYMQPWCLCICPFDSINIVVIIIVYGCTWGNIHWVVTFCLINKTFMRLGKTDELFSCTNLHAFKSYRFKEVLMHSKSGQFFYPQLYCLDYKAYFD